VEGYASRLQKWSTGGGSKETELVMTDIHVITMHPVRIL